MVVCALITSGMRITDTNLLVFLVIQPMQAMQYAIVDLHIQNAFSQ